MQVAWTYWLESWGAGNQTVEMALDRNQTYLIEGFLTKKEGGDYAHVYIAEICTQASDQVLCGVTEDEGGTGIVRTVSSTVSITVGLRTTGGKARAEGVIWQL